MKFARRPAARVTRWQFKHFERNTKAARAQSNHHLNAPRGLLDELAVQSGFIHPTAVHTMSDEITLPSGVKITFTKRGTGTVKPTPKSKVTVHYEGTFLDGRVFDSSFRRGETISFGLNQVIPAWTQAVCEMVVGDRATIFCPSATAYGSRGAGPIPPNTDLLFDVELFEIN
ncbi:MAG TPA: FKBP-type peptidyl-prolyl cis-trans isomerase [Limnobacter sp.]|uniref:FKBP-type peptidyl-prolyl cis-trans isomerase n=1 Tax=Limnobacter sp. TaxID=2003368 RepID=UPI002E33EFB2|nr:FKBP-type peptidyl-prolyl cis-trans isomerase [Limnobacter sp.]HEX5485653.1 FKBP-type peptidyl-prolyl cis-trans isomerase [Limnobacter sp.]